MRVLLCLFAVVASGCVSLPRDHGVPQVQSLVSERSQVAGNFHWSAGNSACAETAKAIADKPLAADLSVSVALACSPRMSSIYFRLVSTQAEIYEATRLANPSLDFARLSTGSPNRIVNTTWSLSQRFIELLLLPARQRLGKQQLLASQQSTAAAVLELERDVRSAHMTLVAAESIAQMLRRAAKAADLSAQTADAFHSAGNISELQVSRERALAVEAEVDAMRAADVATKSRAELYTLLGLAFQREAATAISIDAEMALPPALRDEPATLLKAGLNRLDIQAARTRLDWATREGTLKRSSRFFDDVSIGVEHESETGVQSKLGPTASVVIPLFGLNRGKYLRAEAEAGTAKAELDRMEINLRNESWSVLASALSARNTATLLRERLVPLRARITELTQREFNFMFIGAFELLAAKREELLAYRLYMEAVRDEWLAHFEVQRVAGGVIPTELLISGIEGARP